MDEEETSKLVEICQLQLAEMEMVESMFSNVGEFKVLDYSALDQLRGVVEGCSNKVTSQLEYIINLTVDTTVLEVTCRLPSAYPSCKPSFLVRSNCQDRCQSSRINSDLAKHISCLEVGELCVLAAVSWLQENAAGYMISAKSGETSDQQVGDELRMLRLWIHSHHIYSRTKRRDMIALAGDLRLCGFSLIGKPGIVCVEGSEGNVNSWWKQVKSWTWKRICVRKEDYFCPRKEQCSFEAFRELDFSSDNNRLSIFIDFLKEHGYSESVFRMLVGLETAD